MFKINHAHFLRVAPAVVFCAGLIAFARADNPAPTKFGHHKYDVAPKSVLVNVPGGRSGKVVRMRKPAADAFEKMRAAAREAGLDLIPISGFRSLAYQTGLFKRSIKRRGSEEKAAKWVAPPGYSEHHTGWTLDLGDGKDARTDVDQTFENTALYKWLQQNAGRFGFEISFPKDNPQGVSYEPWHWRFIGTDDARRLFHPN